MKIFVAAAAFLLLAASFTLADEIAPRVRTPLGSIRGYWQLSQHGRQFQSYEGIPYAQPPVGKLRFKPPQPIGAWVGELPATKPGSVCLQYLHVHKDPADRVIGAEDCLYLNVYTPVDEISSTSNGKLLPVIFYIHSGAFQFGEGSSHRPHYLMNKDVVLVTFNYRLGPLGFLSTEDAVVPGNMGLKDQNMALAWVSANIEWFGGDPKKVTLAGLSAGAASVHYHYLSPMSRGLFHRGMSVSGTALDCWPQTEASQEKAKKLGAIMGCPTSSNKEMVRCLRSRPAKSLYEVEGKFMGWLYNPYTPFGPVVERDSSSPFIDKSPIEIIAKGEVADVPWITSVVSEEGLYPAAEFVANKELMKELDENWELIAPHLLDYNYTIPRSEHRSVARKIREHYLGKKPIERMSATALIHMVGDRQFVVDAEKAARTQARVNKSPVWFYYFSYRGEHSLSDLFTGTKENFGVSHADDLAYVFTSWTSLITNKQDLQMSAEMVDLWASYATTGAPDVGGVEWPPVDPSKEDLEYLHISGPGRFNVETNANLGEKKFWSTIPFAENVLPENSVVQQCDKTKRDSSEHRAPRYAAMPPDPPTGYHHECAWPM